MRITTLRLVGMIGLASAVMGSPAVASSKIDRCRAIADRMQRLACFDAMVGRADDEPSEDIVERQKAQFGLTERQKAPDQRNTVNQETVKISAVSGRILTLDNGQVWQLERDSRLSDWIQPGALARIKRGTISGYRIEVKKIAGIEVITRLK